jgi:hypothetical protein
MSRSSRGAPPFVEVLESRHTPSVTFAGQQVLPVGAAPYAEAVADFNGDGRLDLAVANYNDNTVSVLLNATPAGAGAVPSPASRPSRSEKVRLPWPWGTLTAMAGLTLP